MLPPQPGMSTTVSPRPRSSYQTRRPSGPYQLMSGPWGLRAGGAVEGDDAAGEVAPADAPPAVLLDRGGQFDLVGPLEDRLGQVHVRVRVGAHLPGHRGERAHQVVQVDGPERRPRSEEHTSELQSHVNL